MPLVSYLVLTPFRLILHGKMDTIRHKLIFFILLALSSGQDSSSSTFQYSTVLEIPDLSFFEQVYTGLDILEQMDFNPIRNKTITILGNHTAINRNGKHLLDLLMEFPDVKVLSLLAPEYGIWGLDDKRAKLIGKNQIEPMHSAKIIDLFNRYVYPPDWLLNEIDLILVDFQDTGIRYSTFIATMSKVFESASDKNIPVILLDRPNPIRGDIIDGPVPRTEFQSFEGYHLFPIRHGLTLGEAAIMINEMGWVKDSKRINLTVIPMANWNRKSWFDETKLKWQNPIPFLRNLNTLLAYAGMDLFRGTNMNVGFGTDSPYLTVGAPWLVTSFLLEKLNDMELRGVSFKEVKYRPRGSVYYNRVPEYDGKSCSGIQLTITNRNEFDPLATATSMMFLIHRLHPKEFRWKEDGYIDKLFGTDLLRITAAQGKPSDHLPSQWAKDVYKFSEFRHPFLIYE